MKRFAWNNEKNRRLQVERNVSFEQVVFHIEKGRLLDIIAHHNPARYPGQRIFIVDINNYAYLVPFVETELKTIIPSRKATKKYLRGVDNG